MTGRIVRMPSLGRSNAGKTNRLSAHDDGVCITDAGNGPAMRALRAEYERRIREHHEQDQHRTHNLDLSAMLKRAEMETERRIARRHVPYIVD